MENTLYIYGSENPKDNGKIHLCDDDGNVLCGSNIRWGEATAIVEKYEDGKMYTSSFGKKDGNIERSFLWDSHKCLKCSKKLLV